MNVYLIYGKFEPFIFNKKIKYLIDNPTDFNYNENIDRFVGLYAWTTKKKKAGQFMNERGNLFSHIKKDMDGSEFEEFKVFYNTRRLEKMEFEVGNDTIDVYVTKNERVQITDYANENKFEFAELPKFDYLFFREEIIGLLDLISYTTEFDMNRNIFYKNDDSGTISDRMDFASFNVSYNQTVGGNTYNSITYDPFSMLLLLYGYTFDKEV